MPDSEIIFVPYRKKSRMSPESDGILDSQNLKNKTAELSSPWLEEKEVKKNLYFEYNALLREFPL